MAVPDLAQSLPLSFCASRGCQKLRSLPQACLPWAMPQFFTFLFFSPLQAYFVIDTFLGGSGSGEKVQTRHTHIPRSGSYYACCVILGKWFNLPPSAVPAFSLKGESMRVKHICTESLLRDQKWAAISIICMRTGSSTALDIRQETKANKPRVKNISI